MPWSDHSDDSGSKPGGTKPGAAKPGAKKPEGAKPGSKPGPWGAPPAPGPATGGDNGPEAPRKPDRETPRKPPAGGPRRPANPPSSDDLTLMLRRWRQRATTELTHMQTSGAPQRIAAAGLGVALALWVGSGAYEVKTGQQAVVTTFGAYSRTTGVGWGYHLPAPFERVDLVSTGAVEAMDVGAGGADDPQSLMLTADGNIVAVNFTVQYRVSDPKAFLFNVKDPRDAIHVIAESAIRDAVGRVAYLQMVGGGHQPVQNQTRALMQAALDRYGAGVKVVDVQIVGVTAPKEVAPDSQAVAAAKQAAQTSLSDANAYAAKAANEAKGIAAKLRIEAEAYSERTIREAQGEASNFTQVDEEYRRAPAVTKQRLYIETMERILAHSNKVVIDARGASMPLVPPAEGGRKHGPTVEATTPGGGQ